MTHAAKACTAPRRRAGPSAPALPVTSAAVASAAQRPASTSSSARVALLATAAREAHAASRTSECASATRRRSASSSCACSERLMLKALCALHAPQKTATACLARHFSCLAPLQRAATRSARPSPSTRSGALTECIAVIKAPDARARWSSSASATPASMGCKSAATVAVSPSRLADRDHANAVSRRRRKARSESSTCFAAADADASSGDAEIPAAVAVAAANAAVGAQQLAANATTSSTLTSRTTAWQRARQPPMEARTAAKA
mmetsp:Transcript_5534/g.17514  ORF Transcript_5534/g.17514 Transcript_5534/m.17514 type:complete len:263 (-) Transcript_5534:846-1634(-)